MAVVSISRIQVRRGRANEGTGLPQLASGEFGWAVDTQELYIGNGSTAEGAPAVGNTKILTEATNVLELAGQYTYRSDSNIQTREGGAVARTITERLDDRVSVRAFGLTPTISPSQQTEQLQKALFELYLRPGFTKEDAPVLHIEPGEYTLTETVYLPPYTTIIGAGKERTVFKKTGDFPMFVTVSSETSYNGTLATAVVLAEPTVAANALANQARRVRLEHMTLECGDSSATSRAYILSLNNCRDSVFEHVRFKYAPTDVNATTPVIAENEVAIEFVSKNDTVKTQDNTFLECEFIGLDEAVYAPYRVSHNKFKRCKFDFLRRGVILGENLVPGFNAGPDDNVITDSSFENIYEHAFLVPTGTNNKSVQNKYGRSVGNNGGSAGTAAYPIVSYGERGNLSIDDVFDRTYNLAMNESFTPNTQYFPEVEGPVFYTNGSYQSTTLALGAFERTAFRLPADTTKYYTVEYFYKSNAPTLFPNRDFTRSGVLEIFVNRESNTVEITDDYETTGLAAFGTNIVFEGRIQYDDPVLQTEVWAADIVTTNQNDQGDLIIKITSKS